MHEGCGGSGLAWSAESLAVTQWIIGHNSSGSKVGPLFSCILGLQIDLLELQSVARPWTTPDHAPKRKEGPHCCYCCTLLVGQFLHFFFFIFSCFAIGVLRVRVHSSFSRFIWERPPIIRDLLNSLTTLLFLRTRVELVTVWNININIFNQVIADDCKGFKVIRNNFKLFQRIRVDWNEGGPFFQKFLLYET